MLEIVLIYCFTFFILSLVLSNILLFLRLLIKFFNVQMNWNKKTVMTIMMFCFSIMFLELIIRSYKFTKCMIKKNFDFEIEFLGLSLLNIFSTMLTNNIFRHIKDFCSILFLTCFIYELARYLWFLKYH